MSASSMAHVGMLATGGKGGGKGGGMLGGLGAAGGAGGGGAQRAESPAKSRLRPVQSPLPLYSTQNIVADGFGWDEAAGAVELGLDGGGGAPPDAGDVLLGATIAPAITRKTFMPAVVSFLKGALVR